MDNRSEPFLDKIPKSSLPLEFNRKRELYQQLNFQKLKQEEDMKILMKKILDKHNKGENFDDLYS